MPKLEVVRTEEPAEEFDVFLCYNADDKPMIRWVAEREYYLINSHGDPTRYIRVAGKDTSQVYRYQYVYDQHGNWTRKVTIVVKDKMTGKHDNAPVVPRVVDREFVY